MADSEAKPEKTGESVIDEAIERFAESQDGTEFNRKDAYDDIKFGRMGEQWDPNIQKLRQEEGRPCLTINKLPSFVRQVVNDSRLNKPAIKVAPVDNGADVDTASVISGLIRAIERGSGASVAYDTAIDHAVSGGFGFFRLSIDYCNPDTFDMEARIERVPNALMVHWDVNSTKFDASDWEYAFISDFLTQDQFKYRYPKADPVSFEGDSRDAVSYWLEDDKIRIAEYFLRSETKRKLLLVQASDGNPPMAVREDQLPGMAQAFFQAGGMALGGQVDDKEVVGRFMQMSGLKILREREACGYEVTRRVISGVEVLDEQKWPGSMIPICPVWGEEIFIDGRRHFRSLIRDAKDPQTMFNFWRSATTELVALAPKAPWVGPKGFVPPEEKAKWETANSRSYAYLEYQPVSGGAPPQRQPFAGVPAGALQESLNASDDMKAIIGIYDSSLGARSNETSGKAIQARQREADVSNFHFIDNLSRAIQYAGQCLVEIIPSVYGPRETVRILGEDMKEKVVKLTQQGGQPQQGIDGEPRLYNLSVGKYDVSVTTGPSYATAREETRETLIEIMRQIPDSAAYIGDVLLEHMDFPDADKVAKRLKTLLPPAVQQAEASEAQQNVPPEVQSMMANLKTENEQLKQQAAQQAQETEAEMKKAQLEADTKITVAQIQANAQVKTHAMSLNSQGEAPAQLDEQGQPVPGTSLADVIVASNQNLMQLLHAQGQAHMEAMGAHQQMMGQQGQQLAALAEAMSRPKQLVRGPDGRAIGMR